MVSTFFHGDIILNWSNNGKISIEISASQQAGGFIIKHLPPSWKSKMIWTALFEIKPFWNQTFFGFLKVEKINEVYEHCVQYRNFT